MPTENQVKNDIAALGDELAGYPKEVVCTGLSGARAAYLIATLHQKAPEPMVVVLPAEKEARRFMTDVRFFMGRREKPVWLFPPLTMLHYKLMSLHEDISARRIRMLYLMTQTSRSPLIITSVEALQQRLMPKTRLLDFVELLMEGEETDRDTLVSRLIACGYTRTSIVEEPGDFSVRGGILDVFSPLYPEPLRIEFYGDLVDSIRFFSSANQRKLRSVGEAILLPAKEVILPKDQLEQALGRIRARAAEQELPVTQLRAVIDRIKNEGVYPGIEALLPLIYPQTETLFDYFPAGSRFVLMTPGGLKAATRETLEKAQSHYTVALEENRLCVPPEQSHLDWPGLEACLETRPKLVVDLLDSSGPSPPGSVSFHMEAEDNDALKLELQLRRDKEHLLMPLADWIRLRQQDDCLVLLVCGTQAQADRLRDLLTPYGISLHSAEGMPDRQRGKGMAYLLLGNLSGGFVWSDESLALVTEDEIFGEKRRRPRTDRRHLRTELLALEDLKSGDLVVHADHGIGQYQGLEKLQLNGVANDFLLITYRDNDRLYLPVDRMNSVQKYVGVDGIAPVLDKMGGKSWERVKRQAREDVEKVAKELLNIYAARKAGRGHAFSQADSYFRDFETGFSYEETPDQLKAIEDVLDDMETAQPMDRLVCGDVGYGKTEVALRASFKAIGDGKQVAVLVPTTVLAEQHFKTFDERFRNYPVQLACLNRFRTPKEQKQIVADLKAGRIDIVVGTHRLLQKDVGFKDLGLLILDEEQRFGVKHKEKLKKLRTSVDVLALTATPIPRTLHMSLMGIRDISVISTPPEERRAIATYITEYDDGVIQQAVAEERNRGGQIFFVHNNIHSIQKMAHRLQELLPDIRLGVAHGRMKEDELEDVMLKFLRKDIDMLVCTTIIESGLDIPSANTIIINRADRFGLAQIYQLRGRVGRADVQAYAYLFVPKDALLGKDAQKRLKVLMEHSDLGSGFQIAMSDLQIRGGGSALGVSQSGHIAAVGYDMFLQLMENAIAELKGEPVTEPLEPEINLEMSAFLPESYIADIDQRLVTYRRLAKFKQLKEIAELKSELIDRYGPLPPEAGNLMMKMMLKLLCIQAGVKRFDVTENRLALHFSEMHQQRPYGVVDLIASNPKQYQFTPDHVLKIKLPYGLGPVPAVAEAKNILKEIARHVNG